MLRPDNPVYLLIVCLIILSVPGRTSLGQDANPQAVFKFQHEGVVTTAAWNHDGTQILSASEDGALRIWDATSGEMMTHVVIEEPIRGAFWSADSLEIIFWTDAGHVQRLNVENGVVSEPLPTNGETQIGGVGWFQNGQSVLVWESRTVYTPTFRGNGWSAGTITLSHDQRVVSATYNPDLNHITTVTEDERAHIWDASSGQRLMSYRIGATARDAVFSNDELLIASWTADGRAIILDTTRQSTTEFRHRTFVNGVRFNRSQSQIMTWGADDRVNVWLIETGEQALDLLHNDWVNGAVWNADETRILSWAYDRVWIWDAGSGTLLTQLEHENIINGASFHPDESLVLSWGWDNLAIVWDISNFMPVK